MDDFKQRQLGKKQESRLNNVLRPFAVLSTIQ